MEPNQPVDESTETPKELTAEEQLRSRIRLARKKMPKPSAPLYSSLSR